MIVVKSGPLATAGSWPTRLIKSGTPDGYRDDGIERERQADHEPEVGVTFPDPADDPDEDTKNDAVDDADVDFFHPDAHGVFGAHKAKEKFTHCDTDRLIS